MTMTDQPQQLAWDLPTTDLMLGTKIKKVFDRLMVDRAKVDVIDLTKKEMEKEWHEWLATNFPTTIVGEARLHAEVDTHWVIYQNPEDRPGIEHIEFGWRPRTKFVEFYNGPKDGEVVEADEYPFPRHQITTERSDPKGVITSVYTFDGWHPYRRHWKYVWLGDGAQKAWPQGKHSS